LHAKNNGISGKKMNQSDFQLTDDHIDSIPLWYAIVPVVTLIALLAVNVFFYKDDATYGPNQIALVVAAIVAGLFGWSMKIPFNKMLDGINKSIGSALNAILILLMIGALAGTWMMSGVVPAMVCYGLKILTPETFLVACVIICSLVSVITGSSWSTIATVGIALLGIGQALGFPMALTAGAIISGAYFGDKMSPLSDTTNLAPAMAGTDLITHIRYMLWTTVPSITITLIAFLVIGLTRDVAGGATVQSDELVAALSDKFTISWWLMLVPLATLVLVALKVDAVVALFCGAILGGICAVIMQPGAIREIGGGSNYIESSYMAVVNAMKGSIEIATDFEPAKKLMQAKGIGGMMNTVWLIICAMCFGGVMEATGLLQRITRPLVSVAKSTASLVATTTGSCLFLNLTASDQYLAIVVPGRMFQKTYQDRGLAPENLSRTLEDAGTVTSVLVPWNTCGAAQSTVLGVATLSYLPFCFFNILSPLMTMLIALIGLKIAKLKEGNPDNDDHVAEAAGR
jgi:NhaC family Na+:H+ antiporter